MAVVKLGKIDEGGELAEADRYPLLENETIERAAEHLRLALARITHSGAPPIPLSYALYYFYVSGAHMRLNERMDAAFEQGWDFEAARDLFLQYLTPCSDFSIAQLQKEMLSVIDGLAVVSDGAGRDADEHTRALDEQVKELSRAKNPQLVMRVAQRILSEAKDIARESRDMADKMRETTQLVEKLREDLLHSRREAAIDALTGLNNRHTFDTTLDHLIAKGKPFSLVMVDIDHFKLINDEHGHVVGDRVMRHVGKLLNARTRAQDAVSRYGGDEFAILLPLTTLSEGKRMAENIRKGVRLLNMRRTDTGDTLGRVTASLGVAEFRRGDSAEQLIARADSALYAAKHDGRDQTRVAR